MPMSNDRKIYSSVKLSQRPRHLNEDNNPVMANPLLICLSFACITEFLGKYEAIKSGKCIILHQNDLEVVPSWLTQELLILRFNDCEERDLISAHKVVVDLRENFVPNYSLRIGGQQIESQGEYDWTESVLKELEVIGNPTKHKSLKLYIREYSIYFLDNQWTRRLRCTSEMSYYYDEDEDCLCKCIFLHRDESGIILSNETYYRVDDVNRKYYDNQ